MSKNCPVCQTACGRMNAEGRSFAYECPRCGNFVLSYNNNTDLQQTFVYAKANGEEDEKRAIVSHAIRKMQKEDTWPTLKGDLIKATLKRSLPTPSEQKDIFIRWVGDNITAGGEYIKVNSFSILAIIGARTLKEFYFILDHLKKEGLVESKTVVGGGDIDIVEVTLSFDGLEYNEKLERGDTDKRNSFMAIESVPKEQTNEVHDANNDGNSNKPQVFLAHASEDKGVIRQLFEKLLSCGFNPWLDEVNLIPGQNWQVEITKAINHSDIVLACLSKNSTHKQGYVQKEFRLALTAYAEKPPGSIFLIPVKLDDCEMPDLEIPQLGISMCDIQWLELWREDGFEKLSHAINHAFGRCTAMNDTKETSSRNDTAYSDVRSWPLYRKCPKCSGQMMLDHDDAVYECEECHHWE